MRINDRTRDSYWHIRLRQSELRIGNVFTNSASTNLNACVKGTNVHSSEKCVDLIVVFLILF